MGTYGPAEFYTNKFFTDNPPGYLYVFWVADYVKNLLPQLFSSIKNFDLLLKFPANLADLLTGLLIYKIISKKLNKASGIIGFLAYTLNPAVFFNSSIWGQFDAASTFFLFLCFYLLIFKKSPDFSALFFAIAWAIKPQAIGLAPAFALSILLLYPIKKWVSSLTSFVLATLIIYFPFFPADPLKGIIYINERMTGIFSCTTCYAFNFWGIFGNWKIDSFLFLGSPLTYWGIALLIASYSLIFFLKPFKKHFSANYIFFTSALSAFSFFIFATRMHERYLFPVFSFLLVPIFLLRSKLLTYFYIFLSILSAINLYLPYASYNTDLNLTPSLTKFLSLNFQYFSALSFLSFIFLLFFYVRLLYVKKD